MAEGCLLYSARAFDLSEIEGLSQRALQMHQQIYRAHVEAVNRFLQGARGAATPAPTRATAATPTPARATAATPTATRAAAVVAAPSSSLPCPTPDMRFAHEYNGMVLHELFFEELTGALGAIPPSDGAFRSAADLCFGGFDAWKADIRQLAAGAGFGWVLCLRERAGHRIFNCRIESHAIGIPAAADVLLAIDLWEHAWLPDYGPAQRDDYLDAILTQIDWRVIERRCAGD